MAIDGDRNAVREIDCEAAPAGPANPHGNAAKISARPWESELQAQRLMEYISVVQVFVVLMRPCR